MKNLLIALSTLVLVSHAALADYPIRASLREEIAARVKTEKMPTPAYFMVAFGYEGKDNPASQSHTFASYVRVGSDGGQTWSTISYLPATFIKDQKICIFADRDEARKYTIEGNPCPTVPARVYDLTQSVGWAFYANRAVGIWGPYHVKRELYDLGLERIKYLSSGQTQYMADDRDTRADGGPGSAFNCMHAVSDLRGHFYREKFLDRFSYGTWGINGTRYVMKHYRDDMQDLVYDEVDPDQFRKFEN